MRVYSLHQEEEEEVEAEVEEILEEALERLCRLWPRVSLYRSSVVIFLPEIIFLFMLLITLVFSTSLGNLKIEIYKTIILPVVL